MKIKKFHQLLHAAPSTAIINQCLKGFLAEFSIRTFVVTCYYKQGRKNNSVVEYSYPSESLQAWHQYYHEQHYDDVDTTSQQARMGNLPVFWTIEQQIADAKTDREKQMHQDSLSYGADKGLTIPMYRSGDEQAILMVSQLQDENCLIKWSDIQYELLTAAHYYYHYLREKLLQERPSLPNHYQLNQRQLQCLQLTARQYSVSDISSKLNITERTVNYHLQKMNKQLGTKNKHMSVAKAQREGLID